MPSFLLFPVNFNSQPHKEADYNRMYLRMSKRYFNSQPHKEADGAFSWEDAGHLYFNSQPHKEADLSLEVSVRQYTYFNSQPHKEADDNAPVALIGWFLFQLTASQGGWQITAVLRFHFRNFNSQPHKEADGLLWVRYREIQHFNSQPHKEADGASFRTPSGDIVFQLTASQGGWQLNTRLQNLYRYFNSQPHKEADDCFLISIELKQISTHSLTRRLTFYIADTQHSVCISTHSLTRRLTSLLSSIQNSPFISTHSLTRRLTILACCGFCPEIFQLTASQGGWRRIDQCLYLLKHFNSQPHKEADVHQINLPIP